MLALNDTVTATIAVLRSIQECVPVLLFINKYRGRLTSRSRAFSTHHVRASDYRLIQTSNNILFQELARADPAASLASFFLAPFKAFDVNLHGRIRLWILPLVAILCALGAYVRYSSLDTRQGRRLPEFFFLFDQHVEPYNTKSHLVLLSSAATFGICQCPTFAPKACLLVTAHLEQSCYQCICSIH